MPTVAALTSVEPAGMMQYHPQAKPRQRASVGVTEVVELKFSSWYNTD